ncbi:MAG: gluconate 2-dehydrogenase subunit 3 family protein [Bacteroidota bacterium]|nr:gluconate 2-dehydrogenase subunit 3 family protein [Bacteroidota bacterium]
MKRREALKNVSLFISGTLAIPTGSILLNSCSNPSKELGWNPKYLNDNEAFFLSELANTIIPNTEFPGALAVGVPLEIETYVFNVLEEKNISKFRNGLKKLNHFLNNNSSKSSKPFFESNLLEKTKMLNLIQKNKHSEIRIIYMSLKSSVITSYFNSEIGATKVLKYNGPSVVLGSYKGCIPFDEVGKTWAI